MTDFECARCGRDTEPDLVRHFDEGGPKRCSTCGLDLGDPSPTWLTANGYEASNEAES